MRYVAGVVMVVFVMMHLVVYAEEKPGSLDKLLKDMRSMVGKIVPKKSGPQPSTAVSGVRGADADSGDPLYWKGNKDNVTEAELVAFNDALSAAEQGKKEEAAKKFGDFLKTYPSSDLAGDAKKTLAALKSS